MNSSPSPFCFSDPADSEEVVWQSSQVVNLNTIVQKLDRKPSKQRTLPAAPYDSAIRRSGSGLSTLSSSSTLHSSSSSWLDSPGAQGGSSTTSSQNASIRKSATASRPSRITRRARPSNAGTSELSKGELSHSSTPPLSAVSTSGPQLEQMIKRLGSSLKERTKSEAQARTRTSDSTRATDTTRPGARTASTRPSARGLRDKTNNEVGQDSRKPKAGESVATGKAAPRSLSPEDDMETMDISFDERAPLLDFTQIGRSQPPVSKASLPSKSLSKPAEPPKPPPLKRASLTSTLSADHHALSQSLKPAPVSSSQTRRLGMTPTSFTQQLVTSSSQSKPIPKIGHTPMLASTPSGKPKSLGMRVGTNTAYASGGSSTTSRTPGFKVPFRTPLPPPASKDSHSASSSARPSMGMDVDESPSACPPPQIKREPAKSVKVEVTMTARPPLRPEATEADVSMASTNAGDSSFSFECDPEELDQIMASYE